MNNVYFIGIGGIGMSAIARYYNALGKKVSGYDRTESPLTKQLESEGIEVHYEDRPELIPDPKDTLVVYTPAIPSDLKELQKVFSNGYKVVKRSRMLGEISDPLRCLAVAGTHGKTTTSTLLAHILKSSGRGCTAFLGGISKNYDSNLLIDTSSDAIVAEADEFDRSFLQLHPEIAVITAMDADHLDIYGDLAHVRQAFREFAGQVSGTLIKKYGLELTSADTKAKILTYSLDRSEADFHSENSRTDEVGCKIFDLVYPGGIIKDVRCSAPGWVNQENSIAAAAASLSFGIEPKAVKDAIGTFSGVRRRFDVWVNKPDLTYIDDYAHHPAELASALSAIKGMFPARKLTAIFQPHLYTRTRDFAPEFASALSNADKVVLLDIYPARELPIEGVTSKIIFDDVTAPDKCMIKKEELLDWLKREKIDILVSFGAGDIDRLVPSIALLLENRQA